MAVNPISSTNSSAAGITQTQSLSNIDGAAFMQLLLAQMRNQNPLEPMQDREFVTQLSQLNSLNQLEQMNTSLKSLLVQAEPKPDLAQAATLIGKSVEAKDANGGAVTGLVTAVSLQRGVIQLTVNGRTVALSTVTRVSSQPATTATTTAAPAAAAETETAASGRL